MLKCTYHLFCIILLFAACNPSKKGSLRDQVIGLQQKSMASEDQDSIHFFLKKAEKLLIHASYLDSLKSENDYLLGRYFSTTKFGDSARLYLYRATTHVKERIKHDRQADYFYDAWDAYLNHRDYGESFAISQRFLSLIDPEKDIEYLHRYYYFDEGVYKTKRDYENAITVNKKRIRLLERMNDTIRKGNAIISQAFSSYFNGNRTVSYRIFDSLIAKQQHLTSDHKRQIYGNYGVCKFYDKEYASSRNLYEQGIRFTKKEVDPDYRNLNLGTAYTNLAEVNIMLQDTLRARQYLDSVQTIGLQNVRDNTRQSYFNYRGQLAFEKARNYKGVKSHIENYVAYLEDTYEEKYTSELASLKTANSNEKEALEEKQRIELENIKNKNRVLFISLFTALLAALAFLFFRNRKFKFERQSLQMQQRLLRSQMNPHFTFNTLYAIQTKIKESPEQASNYLLKFSRLLRLVLENSMNNNVALDQELDSLQKYIELQLLRFPGKFSYHIELSDVKDTDLIFIPPMLIQPFVENSIEHGFKGIDYPGHIEIRLSEEGRFINCTILDNGRGIRQRSSTGKKSASVQLISDFIKKSTKRQLKITSNDLSEKASGTKVTFLIPYKLTEHD